MCPIYYRSLESTIHALWECVIAQDVWVGSVKILQKGNTVQDDMLQLLEYLIDRLSLEELELFLTQAWFIWSRRNSVIHGGRFTDPNTLNRRAA